MNKSEAIASFKWRLEKLYRFESCLSDNDATLMHFAKITGFIDGLQMAGLITYQESAVLYRMANNCYSHARRAA